MPVGLNSRRVVGCYGMKQHDVGGHGDRYFPNAPLEIVGSPNLKMLTALQKIDVAIVCWARHRMADLVVRYQFEQIAKRRIIRAKLPKGFADTSGAPEVGGVNFGRYEVTTVLFSKLQVGLRRVCVELSHVCDEAFQ